MIQATTRLMQAMTANMTAMMAIVIHIPGMVPILSEISPSKNMRCILDEIFDG